MWWTRYEGLPFGDGPGQHTCWGLVRAVLEAERGIHLPAYGEISASDLVAVARAMRDGAEADPWRVVQTPQPFDVVLMRHPRASRVGHVGITTKPGWMLHTQEGSNSCLVRLNDWSVKARVLGYRRHVDLA